MARHTSLAIASPRDLLFGSSPRPLVTRHKMTIGGGCVYPELNFTLPAIAVEAATMATVLGHYREIITQATRRAVELDVPGLVVEFETLPPMTETPQWGIDITRVLVDGLHDAHARHGLKSTLRVTPNDLRDTLRPPHMRSGHHWDRMVETFEGCAAAGAELLSIESLGGKEIHDDALMMGDLPGVIFALCVLGVRDMQFLWPRIVQIAQRHHAVAAGDTACGFGNTAMVLAEQKSLPRVLAAVVRAVTAVRSLVAYECGAVGPGKDCGYENPFLKAITGFPMAMEGKSASCAHLSPVGNIAAATCDTWSNESVQNVRLLGAMAPICSLEQLVYDCRLMNQASADGPDAARQMQRWMVKSDAALDPQAFILQPESVIRVAAAIVAAPDYYHAGIAAARTALTLLRTAHAEGALRLSAMEVPWLNTLTDALDGMPDREDTFIRQMMSVVDTARFRAQDYQIDA